MRDNTTTIQAQAVTKLQLSTNINAVNYALLADLSRRLEFKATNLQVESISSPRTQPSSRNVTANEFSELSRFRVSSQVKKPE